MKSKICKQGDGGMELLEMARITKLGGHPMKIYDNGGKTIDRYTVVFLDQCENKLDRVYACLGMNGVPFHPQGFCQHSDAVVGKHLGKRIRFSELPADCQKAVMQEWTA
jgi:hypothetical protein